MKKIAAVIIIFTVLTASLASAASVDPRHPLSQINPTDTDFNMSGYGVFNASSFELQNGLNISGYAIYDQGNSKLLEWDTGNSEWDFTNGNLDLNGNNITSIDTLHFQTGMKINGSINTSGGDANLGGGDLNDVDSIDGGGDAVIFEDVIDMDSNTVNSLNNVMFDGGNAYIVQNSDGSNLSIQADDSGANRNNYLKINPDNDLTSFPTGNVEIPNGNLDVKDNEVEFTDSSRESWIKTFNGGRDLRIKGAQEIHLEVSQHAQIEGGGLNLPDGNLDAGGGSGTTGNKITSGRHVIAHPSNHLEMFDADDGTADSMRSSYNGDSLDFKFYDNSANSYTDLINLSEGGNIEIPNGKLVVNGEDGAGHGIEINDNIPRMSFVNQYDADTELYSDSGNYYIDAGDDANDDLIVKDGGNVEIPNGQLGIGTSPDDDLAIGVNRPRFEMENTASGGNTYRLGVGDATSEARFFLYDGSDSATVFRADTNQNVHIPSGNLDVSGGKVIAGGDSGLEFQRSGYGKISVQTTCGDPDCLRFRSEENTQNIALMYDNGNVKIPNGNLNMNGNNIDMNGQGYITFDNADGEYYLGGGNTPDSASTGVHLETNSNPSSGSPIFVVESSGGSKRLRVEHDGTTSTSNDFDVNGKKLRLPRVSGSPSGRSTGDIWYDTSAD